MNTTLRAGALSLALLTAVGSTALAQTAPAAAEPQAAETMFQATTFNLTAYGETRLAPDMATITLGVTTDGKTAVEAMQANATRMTAVTAALRKAGVAPKDIQTSGLNLNPQYHYEDNKPPTLTGYQAANQVTISVLDLGKLGATVDATVAAGVNQINGISFGLRDPAAAENAARQQAVRALQAKVELYGRATGYRASRLVSLSEGGSYSPSPPMPMMAMARMKADTTPISAGEIRVRIDVTGVYELTR